MSWNFEKNIELFNTNHKLLLDGKWGVERETQRTTLTGELALTPHPKAFGDKIINQEITTDFSESQLEFITPAFSKIEKVSEYLERLYHEAAGEIEDEILWPFSMPPQLPEDQYIPVAQFDESDLGKQSYLYRIGLGNRYGKKMQMISGIHFNFSFGTQLMEKYHKAWGGKLDLEEFQNQVYFAVARNFLRYRWLLIYLFGASPSFDATYLSVVKKELEQVNAFCPECIMSEASKHSTSYRVSRFGYSSEGQKSSGIRYNSKKEYVDGIYRLMKKKSRRFAHIKDQLNDRVLQKESEFYSSIRVKQITKPGETQMEALIDRGVKYAEVRILDVDPFHKSGIGLEQMRFMQVFMLYCLLKKSNKLGSIEMKRLTKNHNLVALLGRKPDLCLYKPRKGRILLKDWGITIFDELLQISQIIDQGNTDKIYTKVMLNQKKKITDISLLPSQVMEKERKENNDSYLSYGIRKAENYKNSGGK